MSQYNFKIKHRQGKSLVHVDYLSRNPISKVEKFKKFYLEMELWARIITKVEGKKPLNRKETCILTNEVWYTGK